MKKLIALMLALALASTLTLSALAENAPATVRTFGTLSMLNVTEEECAAFLEARLQAGGKLVEEGYAEQPEYGPGIPPEGVVRKIVFYDTLDALLMALNAGDIDGIETYQSVARYLCAANDNLQMGIIYDMDKERNTFAEMMLSGIIGNDFAFLMMKENAALRDEFNAAIVDMKADGTLERLVKEQIDNLIDGGESMPIALPKIDGVETVKVAVTGSLPPMDYVAADGTPAGFNTAVLAEIGTRIGRNIEIVVVDSLGRAAALASGTVDAVFWIRTSNNAQGSSAATEAEHQSYLAKMYAAMTEEEIALINEMNEPIDFRSYGATDMPDGTIVTESYFSDVLVPVFLVR